MTITETLTPKDTEEIKPGLFIQRRKKGWRVVHPVAWNGKIRWKEQMRTIFTFRSLISLAIVIFVAWSYFHDNQALINFHDEIITNPDAFCNDITLLRTSERCTDFLQRQGMCDFKNTTFQNISIIP